MTPLPRALAPWAPWLEGWAPAVVPSFAALLGRIEGWLGPGPRPDPAPDGPPAGFDGISRAGPYTRLLTSEWLLAEEAPDEFLRRAVDHEHAFVHLARENPRPRRGLVALFDAGPSQLGQPRLVHLALLVVLARRAERARTHLRWGVLQSPARHEGAGADAIRALIAGRSANLPPLDAVGRDDLGADEVWIIGGPETDDVVAPRARRLYVEDAPGTGPLTLRERGRGGALELPPVPGPVAARLLRDPFEPTPPQVPAQVWKAYPESLPPPTMLQMLPGTQHLVAWHPQGQLCYWRLPVPGVRGALRYRLAQGPSDGSTLAAGWYADRPLLLQVQGDTTLHLQGRPRASRADNPPGLVPGVGQVLRMGEHVWFLDGVGTVWRWSPGGVPVREELTGVVELYRESDSVRALRREGTTWSVYELPSGRVLGSFEAEAVTLAHAAGNAGTLHALAEAAGELRRIRLRAGWEGEIKRPGEVVERTAFPRGGRHVGAGLFLVDDQLCRVDGKPVIRFSWAPRLCVASLDGTAVAVVSEAKTFELWSVPDRVLRVLRRCS